jgi:RNA polymerase sigma-70 factor (ECF subfamily)
MRDIGLTCAGPLPGAASAAGREERVLEERAALERFLAGVERRAFRIAEFAVRNRDDALDIVQDSMLSLVRSYARSPADEWPLLFFGILRNRILDHQRRGGVRRRVLAFFSRPGDATDDDRDPVAERIAAAPGPESDGPEHRVTLTDAMAALERAVAALPERQQQAFLLRTLEGLDVSTTAAVMGCSEGSVKTHLSRAVHALRAALGEHWP